MGKNKKLKETKFTKKTGSRDAAAARGAPVLYFLLRPSGRAATERFSALWIGPES